MEKLETKVILKNVRLSYAHLFEPRAMEGSDEKKYSCVALISKTDTDSIERLRAGVANAIKNANLQRLSVQAALDKLVHDGDERDSESYKGMWYVNAKTDKKPNVCKVSGDGKSLLPVTDEEEVYSGCFAMMSFNLHAYNRNGNMGVGAYIRSVCKTADGERLSGGVANASDDFGLPYAATDNDDLVGSLLGDI